MYTVDWATKFEGFTKEDPIDLYLFAQFYEKHIANYRFEYRTDNDRLPEFVIESEGSQLPHLMGLQHWNNLSTSQASFQYKNMLEGKWDLSFLQAADLGAWKEYRERIEFTPLLYNLLHKCDCTIKLVHQDMPSIFKRRRIDMFFQKDHSKLVFALELREVRNNGIYKPVSLTTHSKNSRSLQGKHHLLRITNVNVRPI